MSEEQNLGRDVEHEIDLIYDLRGRVHDFVVPAVPESGPAVCDHGLPSPPDHMRLNYGGDAAGYLFGGRWDVAHMRDILLAPNGYDFASFKTVLELGCAAGRLTRWIKDFAPEAEVWGVDIDAPRIEWAKAALHSRAHFAMTTKLPHLPFADGRFDLIYAFSVFSHIDDLTDAWLLELYRVTAPGGCVVVTIMDEATVETLLADENPERFSFAEIIREYEHYYRSDYSTFSITRYVAPNVFHRRDRFLKNASRTFRVVDAVPGFHGWQTGVVLARD